MIKLDANHELTLSELFQAYYDCRKNKRNTHNALQFELNLESNIYNLYHDLINDEYEIGKSIVFAVSHPKIREIWAADFRDRIVHHLVYNRIQEHINKRLIHQTYACIKNRGGLAAVDKLESYIRSLTQDFTRPCYYLKLDIQSFFMSINKTLLKEKLGHFLERGWLFDLACRIIDHSPQKNYKKRGDLELLNSVPRHKSLFFVDSNTGIPIGNLSSQFFANVYLDGFDKYMKHCLGQKYYVRYVDDFVLLSENKAELKNLINPIDSKLVENRLNLHRTKIQLRPIRDSVDFLGFKLCGRFKVPGYRVINNYKKSEKTLAGTNSSFSFMCKARSYTVRKELGSLTKFNFKNNFRIAHEIH